MCGIAGVYIKDRSHGFDLDALSSYLLLGIETRGRDATGYGVIDWEGQEKIEKYAVPAYTFNQFRDRITNAARIILLHARYTTQGTELENENNHPVRFEDTIVTHNGVITNDTKLFKELEMEPQAKVDSEVIAASLSTVDLADTDAVGVLLKEIKGSMSIAAINLAFDPCTLLLAKGDTNPLVVFEHDKIVVWASESQFIREAWGKVIGTPPAHGKMKHMKTRTGRVYQPALGMIEFEWEHDPFVSHNTHYINNYGWGNREYSDNVVYNNNYRRNQIDWDINTCDDDVSYFNGYCEECEEDGIYVTWYYLRDKSLCDSCSATGMYKSMTIQDIKPTAKPVVTLSRVESKTPLLLEKCMLCNVEYSEGLMNRTYGICEFCVARDDRDDPANPEEPIELAQEHRLDELYHTQAIGCCAYVNRVDTSVVDFLLFDRQADEAIQSSTFLQNIWKSCDDVYAQFHKGLHNNSLSQDEKGMLKASQTYQSVIENLEVSK